MASCSTAEKLIIKSQILNHEKCNACTFSDIAIRSCSGYRTFQSEEILKYKYELVGDYRIISPTSGASKLLLILNLRKPKKQGLLFSKEKHYFL